MLITLMSKDKLITRTLPKICNGKYWLEDKETNTRLISIEADTQKNKWIIKSTLTTTLYDNSQQEVDVLVLKENNINYVKFGAGSDNAGFLFVQADSADDSTFDKYKLMTEAEISIGRGNNCAICIDNPYVSGIHAAMTFQNNGWKLSVNKDSNGTYLNGERFNGSELVDFGSCIYIFGVKIIVENGFIAVNNPADKVRLSENFFKKVTFDNSIDGEEPVIKDTLYYYRSPRFIRSIEPLSLKVDMPPQEERMEDKPILLTLAPSMVMGVASFSTGIITLVNALNSNNGIMSAVPTLIMSVSMLIGMIVFPFIMKKRDVNSKKKKEMLRREKYLRYIMSMKAEVERGKRYQTDILNENNPPILDKTRKADFWKSGLWSKSPDDSDYLFVRLGVGNMPMLQDIVFPEEKFTLDDDAMRDALFAFQAEEKLLINVPIGIDLVKSKCVGISGDAKNVINAVNVIAMQIALLHGYDEVKLGFIGEKRTLDKLEYIRNINHIWNDDKTVRYLAVTEEETRRLSVELNRLLIKRREAESNKLPYMIIFVTDRQLAKQASFLDEIDWENDEKLRVIYCYADNDELPRECDTIVKLEVSSGLIYGKTVENYYGINFVQDFIKMDECNKAIQKSLKYRLNVKNVSNSLPKTYSFMEMFGVGKAEHLNIANRWNANNPTQSLKTEVGISPSGEKFYLDLHEKFHGPHGLVAGMTGSGKSEFIISYILSMAVNYHPDEVAFVLIDYKGGGLAGAFDNDNYRLPHLAGTITNLDSGAVYRSILSINSELKHRQAVFNDVKQQFGEGTMDIYKYQKMYRAKLVKEPLPHLFIISDEFAELKDQQPEFMDELISTARIGRSLGVHLILATQKPSGVVNEQIWANSKFKVCLKVQDKSDSMEMLKRPEAAELTDTGRFYLQVGYNELFLVGQSAWSGAKYPDTDEYKNEGENDIEIIDNQGSVVERIKFNKTTDTDNGEQIVRIMEYIDALAKEMNIKERQLWLPEIPEKIYLDELVAKYGMPDTDRLTAVAGELDDPYTQSQRLLTVDFETNGNVIVYGNSTSGAGMFVETLLFSLFEMYSPTELNTYLLDFENESLKMFACIPHVGDVVTDGEDEKINNLYSILAGEIKRRREALSQYGGSIEEYNKTAEKKLPKILVVISNYSHFAESYERLEDANIALSRDGMKYGIYFLMTANSASAIRYRVAQNFNQHFVLKLNDPTDYTAILGSVGGRTPEKYVGRGMLKNKNIYTFQTARITYDNENLREYVMNFAEALNKRYDGVKAPRVPVIPKFITSDRFADMDISLGNIPIGMNFKNYSTVTLDLLTNPLLGVMADKSDISDNFLSELLKEISKIDGVSVKAFDSADEEFEKIYNVCLTRNNEYKTNNGKVSLDMSPMVIVINSYAAFKAGTDVQNADRIDNLLKAIEPFWNMYFIVVGDSRLVSDNFGRGWLEKLKENAVWLGNGVNSIRSYMGVSDIANNVADYSGYYFKNGRCQYAKFVMSSEQEEKDE